MDYGLRSAPILTDSDFYEQETFAFAFGEFVFNFTYWFLLVIVLIAMISGLIIDTFGQARRLQFRLHSDIQLTDQRQSRKS